jgi:hypothetical protein
MGLVARILIVDRELECRVHNAWLLETAFPNGTVTDTAN